MIPIGSAIFFECQIRPAEFVGLPPNYITGTELAHPSMNCIQ